MDWPFPEYFRNSKVPFTGGRCLLARVTFGVRIADIVGDVQCIYVYMICFFPLICTTIPNRRFTSLREWKLSASIG